jgi:hypothetical protein
MPDEDAVRMRREAFAARGRDELQRLQDLARIS